MANIRNLKKDLTYLVKAVASDAYVALCFQPAEKRDAIFEIIAKAAELDAALWKRINRPEEPHNASLVRKHYAQIRREMVEGIEALFGELSDVCKN